MGNEEERDLAFNNVKPKDWYFVLDLVQDRIRMCIKANKLSYGVG